MIELYRTKNERLHRKAEIALARHLGTDFRILRTNNGKPYIEGNPLYFSLAHSRNQALIAICDKPIGADLEICDERRNFKHILKRFTESERQRIGDCAAEFYANWTAKEAFVKMRGGTLASDLKRLEFNGRAVLCDGIACDAAVTENPPMVYAVCAEGYSRDRFVGLKLKWFRLRKGEYL